MCVRERRSSLPVVVPAAIRWMTHNRLDFISRHQTFHRIEEPLIFTISAGRETERVEKGRQGDMGGRGTEGTAAERKLHISETKPHDTKHLSSVVPL